MQQFVRAVVLLLLWNACGSITAQETSLPTEKQLAFFESKIRPLLVDHCYECHSAEAKVLQGGLRLDHRGGVLQGGDSGPVVAPGNPKASLLIKALNYDGLEMPPKGKLPDEAIRVFETWVAMGVPDPRKIDAPRNTRSVDLEAGRQHWAFQRVTDPRLPAVQCGDWLQDPVDWFVLAGLEASRLQPVGDADPYRWLRRVHFDLTGLPPTDHQIEEFVQDPSPQAKERVVDRLMSSRAFGERWARHWLDLTGYADQVGTSNDVFSEHAWRYRDYLVDSFNSDKPFDRFLIEQIAGDLLPFASPEQRANNLIATGFLLVGDVEIVNPDKLKMETDHIDAQLSKIGTVFLGMTLGCVRCHDHKFDPIGLEDYYAMAGTLRSTVSTRKIPNGIWSGLNVVELPETPLQMADRQARASAQRARREELIAERQRLEQEAASLPQDQAQRRNEITQRTNQIAAELQHAEFFAATVPKALALQDAVTVSDMPIMIRGNPYAPGKTVARGILRVAAWEPGPTMPRNQSGRLQLAEWLADSRQPLTARVAVNRIWEKLFGEGIVRSVDYFGTRGERPTHPELLDHLATRFIQGGWSQKKLIRALVLSRVYGLESGSHPQASRTDPENRLLWRMNPQRLDAEALRDAMLAASGELVHSSGGPALPLEYLENTGNLAPAAVNPPSFSLRRFRPEQEFVRTLYLPIVRSAQAGPSRLRDVFDFTQPAQIAGKRPQTVVATQALYLLNNELPRQRAKVLARAVEAIADSRDVRLDVLWLRVLGRPIHPPERAEALAYLDSLPADADGWVELCHALLASNEFIHRL